MAFITPAYGEKASRRGSSQKQHEKPVPVDSDFEEMEAGEPLWDAFWIRVAGGMAQQGARRVKLDDGDTDLSTLTGPQVEAEVGLGWKHAPRYQWGLQAGVLHYSMEGFGRPASALVGSAQSNLGLKQTFFTFGFSGSRNFLAKGKNLGLVGSLRLRGMQALASTFSVDGAASEEATRPFFFMSVGEIGWGFYLGGDLHLLPTVHVGHVFNSTPNILMYGLGMRLLWQDGI